MKKLNFNHNMLATGVALALGLVAGNANASTTSGSASVTGTGAQISNTATAVYSVDGQQQPTVTSNAVVVNVNEIGSFTLVATQGASNADDKNENQVLTAPSGSVTFTNELKNTGNVADTYTIKLDDAAAGIITGVTDKFGYTNEATTDINVTINGVTTTIKSGQTITLQPGQTAALSYALIADGTGVGGDSGLATLSATSTYITKADASKATLTNEDQAILKLPVFKIQKTASSTNIDLNTTSTFDYTITVTNDNTAAYAADATNILIQDAIPAGLNIVNPSSGITVTSPNAVKGSTASSTATKLVLNGADLKVGETITIKFTVTVVDKAALAAAGSAKNNADVYDNYDSTPVDPANPSTANIHDSTSTDSTSETKVPNDTTGTTGTGADNPSTVNFTNRGLTMTSDNSKELAPDGSVNVTHTITNTGNQAEGDVAGELVLAITEGTADGAVQPTGNIVVTIKDSAGNTVGTKTYPDGTTSIDFHDVATGGIPAGGTATVAYTESSTANYDASTQNPVTPSDTTKLVLTPSGAAAPAAITNTDTYSIKDMDLVKTQALDATCDGNADTAYSTSPVSAKPGECVIYQITATNNFTSKALTNVVISDAASQWSTKATYVAGSAKDSEAGAVTQPGTAVVSSGLSIPAGGTDYLQFSVKIKTVQ